MDDAKLLLVWGKTRGLDRNATEGHPLLYHLIDVAVCAEALWDIMPAMLRWRIAHGVLGLGEGDARRSVTMLAGLHDLGKASGFQAKVGPLWERLQEAGLNIPLVDANVPHAAVTAASAVLPDLLTRTDACGMTAGKNQQQLVQSLVKAVGAHHGAFPQQNVQDPAVLGGRVWANMREALARRLAQALYPGIPAVALSADEVSDPVAGALFTGFIAVADWIGSSQDHFGLSHEPDIDVYASNSRRVAQQVLRAMGWLPVPQYTVPVPFDEIVWGLADGQPVRYRPRGIQSLVQEMVDETRGPYLLICEAAMGEGKTEAALYCIDRATTTGLARGAAVCMPTQATGNAMFDRVVDYLMNRGHLERLNIQLVHGSASYHERFAEIRQLANGTDRPGAEDEEAPVVAEAWFTGGRQALLAPFGVGTIDQSLMGVLQTRHWFVRLFGLAGKTVVFDEVHAYDAYMNELLKRLVRWLSAMDCSVVLLSATLPRSTRSELVKAYDPRAVEVEAPYPRVTLVPSDGPAVCRTVAQPTSTARATELVFAPTDPTSVAQAIGRDLPGGGCAVVVCNTVRNAQAIYAACAEGLGAKGWEVELFHARTLARWRKKRETAVLDKLGKPGRAKMRPERYVLIGTQVLEQSLDFDADWMASEFAPVDLLLQRMGRLWRHERPSRPMQAPRFTVLVDVLEKGSAGEVETPTFPMGSDLIYDAYLLLRSFLVLRGRTWIEIPTDIEPLIRAVYDDSEPAELTNAWRDRLRRACEHMVTTQHNMKGVALVNLIPDWRKRNGLPKDFATIYESTAHLDDGDDPGVHQSLRAQTRLGDPTITIVCVERQSDGRVVPVGEPAPDATLTMDEEKSPNPQHVKALLESSVAVARPKRLYYSLLDQAVPTAWAKDRHLRYARLALFEGGVAQVNGFRLTLTPELGLAIEKEEPA